MFINYLVSEKHKTAKVLLYVIKFANTVGCRNIKVMWLYFQEKILYQIIIILMLIKIKEYKIIEMIWLYVVIFKRHIKNKNKAPYFHQWQVTIENTVFL